MSTKLRIAVKPGQIWADTDKRGYGRRVRIVELDGVRHALVEPVLGGRRSRILYDQYGLLRYRLVSESNDSTRAVAEQALHDRVAKLRRVKLNLNEDEIWVLYRLVVAEQRDSTPRLLPDLAPELEHAMGMALAKLSSAHMDLTAPAKGDI